MNSPSYEEFLTKKRIVVEPSGFEVDPSLLHSEMKDFQRDVTAWAIRKGKAALCLDTGLGKTLCQLQWAEKVCEHTRGRVLILAPLAVAGQTVKEGERWGIPVTYARCEADAAAEGITITNYEMLPHFKPERYAGVVIDESAILQSFTGKTRTAIIDAFSNTPYRLACSATPAPNDITELGNHAEFLGVMSETEMKASFFVHVDNEYRLKGHAEERFYEWLSSWMMALKFPSDLGYSDEGYLLPPLSLDLHQIPTDYVPEGQLFAAGLKGITDRSRVRKGTLSDRVTVAAELILAEPEEHWIAWYGLLEEGRELKRLLPNAIFLHGSMSLEEKTNALMHFVTEGGILITHPKIAGQGLNLQHCAREVFVGIGDSFKDLYQCVRRVWRFGQLRPVNIHVVISELEFPVYQNVTRKADMHNQTSSNLISRAASFEKAELEERRTETFAYEEREERGQDWRMLLGDSAVRLRELPENSIAMSVFSQPFDDLYTYSPTERDLGNCRTSEEFWEQFGFIIRELFRVTMPGRNVCAHVQQIATQKEKDGVIGLRDFRGETIREFTRQGFIYHGEMCIDKDPQAQAIRLRGRAKGLRFSQKDRDSSWCRPALADYIIVFRKPGENPVPIVPDISNEEWIELARPIWYGVNECETLNAKEARSSRDERHVCPLQLQTIRNCVRLYSNPDETVLSPFAGIGSEGHEAVLLGRKFVGVELNPNYFSVATKNLKRAERKKNEGSLLSLLDEIEAAEDTDTEPETVEKEVAA